MISNPAIGSLGWFARHEFNLSWRDFVRMMSAGKPGRERGVTIFLIIAALITHVVAYLLLDPTSVSAVNPDKSLLLLVSGCIALTFSLMMSQAMELVTRVFYSRSDLDLILSSPVSERRVFAVRIGAIAVSSSMLPMLLFGAAINVMAIFDTPIWLAAYLVIFSLGAIATAASLSLTVFMFKSLGAKRTRLISQIVAAIVGAGFIIGVQLAAIASMNSISRLSIFQSEDVLNAAPAIGHAMWIPAYAAMGDWTSLLQLLLVSMGLLAATILIFSGRFGEYVITAAGLSEARGKQETGISSFKLKSMRMTLIQKEWRLLLRDHWLISQTLMQVLYLLPPAYMLWQGFGGVGALAGVGLPVLVMATGQLAGGLAWLAISGEDAPQLVQTAPINVGAIIRAKVEAVLSAIGILVSPIVFFLLIADPLLALIAIGGIAASGISATMIQLWFRSQANRASFRRRQTSSKVATLAEALSSILWAGTTGLLAGGAWQFAPLTIVLAVGVLWTARSFRPSRDF
jgi:ABC-2 type transport system permease protein